MKNTNKLAILATLALLTLNGCGGSSAESTTVDQNIGELQTVDVDYTLNGKERPTCHNADDIGELKPSPTDFVLCIWLCGKYQGSETIKVSINFMKNPKTEEGIWELEDERLSEASEHICRDI